MILDLHTHSIVSDDGRAKVENYCQWIRKRDLPLDGFVLTEHRQYDDASDYRAFADEYGLVILKASEVESDYGHVLVFGVNEELRQAFDFARVDLPLGMVLQESKRCGAVAVPCHPGRVTVGMCAHFETRGPVEGVEIIEVYNGGSREGEDELALALAEERGYRTIGGSDSHIVSHIGRCGTEFSGDIKSIDDLVDALRGDTYEARTWR
jgi:predicted metal-dependent phosphoesterase TrpH